MLLKDQNDISYFMNKVFLQEAYENGDTENLLRTILLYQIGLCLKKKRVQVDCLYVGLKTRIEHEKALYRTTVNDRVFRVHKTADKLWIGCKEFSGAAAKAIIKAALAAVKEAK